MGEENLRRGHGRQALNRNYELDRPAMATVNAKKRPPEWQSRD
jgi:hypothetical protein